MKTPITSLAAFKRALTINSRWLSRYSHLGPNADNPTQPNLLVSDWEEKQVVHIQSNAVAFSIGISDQAIASGKQKPRSNASWLSFPKAHECTFNEDAVRITHSDPLHWREYRPLHAARESAAQ